jgi:hypothetical protein
LTKCENSNGNNQNPEKVKIISEINSGPFKTTIYAWNNKYLIKYEAEQFEQTYKVSQFDITSEEEVKKLAIDPGFVKSVSNRFENMAKDFYTKLESIG